MNTSKDTILPEIVYHYTSIEALLGIVGTRSLWCTAISYLNDKLERDYVLNAVKLRLPDLISLDSIATKGDCKHVCRV